MPKKLTTETFIERARMVHGDKYDYSKSVYQDKKCPLTIICSTHGEFRQSPHHHLWRKQGCPICAKIQRAKSNTKTVDNFLKIAHEVHGDEYDYSRIEYNGRRTPMAIVCKRHGVFYQTAQTHIKGSGCPKCAIERNAESQKIGLPEFVRRAKDIHGDRYDYSLVEYNTSKDLVAIKCPIHGVFKQVAMTHLCGHGCPACVGKERKDTQKFIMEAQMIHGDRYDYSQSKYVNFKTPLKIICRKHGAFEQSPASHYRGSGCPVCGMDARKSLVCGVGVNDLYGECGSVANNTWSQMLLRCYSETTRHKFPTYVDVTVCEEWHKFSNFKKWFDENYVDGYALDKDIIIKGNKVYSPETCCFVPREINTIFTKNNSMRGDLPIGVKHNNKKFSASFGKRGRECFIGTFETPLEAFLAYKEAKEAHIKEIATEYYSGGKITKRVYDALMRWHVEITD